MKDSVLLIAAAPRQHTPALQRCFDLARTAEVPVHICLFVHESLIERSAKLIHPEVQRLAREQFLDERRQWMDELVSRWRADDLHVTGEVIWAPRPHEAILAKVLQRKPALVIKDIGHEPLLKRITFTALDWKLVRDCPAPLMLVHTLSSHLPRQVLAAVDTTPDAGDVSSLNDLILREALKVADWVDAGVQVAHVFPYQPLPAVSPRTMEALYYDTRAADQALFKSFAEAHQIPDQARCWLEGEPVYRLAEAVRDRNIDLLVLGSTYKTPLDRLLLGSTAESMLFRMPCDMLLVKPPEFAAALGKQAA